MTIKTLITSCFMLALTCGMSNHLVTHGIPLLHADLPGIWDEYYDIIEWHEIGAPDPRYQDPCGPGPHEGDMGKPGCHGED